MADVLSQSEIDALLSALSTGDLEPEQIVQEEDKHKIKVYDFRSPQKFSKDHIRTLEMIHDNFARILSNYLTGQIRKNVKVKIETVEQITYEEFIHSVQNPTIMTLFKMPPLNGTILFETNLDFSYQVLDILLGGTGERKRTGKEITDIDKNIMYQITDGMISNLKLAWEDIIHVEPEIESIEKLIDKLVVQYWFKNDETEDSKEVKQKMENVLKPIEVDIEAELGRASLTVDDFLKLNSGDIIRLDNNANNPIKVLIENKEYYYAKPGLVGKNMGISILEIINKDVNDYE